MSYSQPSFVEPVEIRAHHLNSWAQFLLSGGSERGLIGSYEDDIHPAMNSENNHNGYGRKTFTHVANTWGYLTKKPQARIKITESFDVICSGCRKNPLNDSDGTCDNVSVSWFDDLYAKLWKIEIGREYTSQEMLDRMLAACKPDSNKLRSVIRSLQSAGSE